MISPWRTGVALGAFVGFWHLLWSALVALGGAGPLIGFILRIHFIDIDVQVAPFDPALAAILVIVTTVVGFIGGAMFAGLWNWLHVRRMSPVGASAFRS
jgi:hypothetical protein